MKVIDRIILIALVAGVWALVLKPGTPSAHHSGAYHDCSLSGVAFGDADIAGVRVYRWDDVSVDCSH